MRAKEWETMGRSAFLQACVQSSSEAIMLTRPDGTIFYVNGAWENLFGFNESEVVGQNPRILRSGHHTQAFYTQMWHDILDPKKGSWKGEVVNRTKDGREVTVLLTISPCRSSEGELLGYMSIAVDLTDKKMMEAQLQWQDRLATIGSLASGLAHELGTPLGVVRGRAEYLLHTLAPKNGEQHSLQTIIAQIDKVSALMHSLQNLGRLSPSEARVPVNVREVANEVGELLRGKFEPLGISFTVETPLDAKVTADSGRLEYVLLNLCLNSVHAIEQRSDASNHYIRIQTKDEGAQWKISVSDSGGGISPEHLPHIFKPFFTTKDVGAGTGLGLAVTYQTVQSWNGTVDLENRFGVGATFHIHLPKA